MAASRASLGAKPIAESLVADSWLDQSLLLAMGTEPAKSRSDGFASGFATPCEERDGPLARTMSDFAAWPVTMKPAIRTSSPDSNCARVEMLASRGLID